MKRKNSIVPILTGVAVMGISFLTSARALAQNCALCYTQAAASGARVIQALRSGIAILVVAPMAICSIITYMAYKKNNRFNEELPCSPIDGNSLSDESAARERE
jgi:hypothetical protein